MGDFLPEENEGQQRTITGQINLKDLTGAFCVFDGTVGIVLDGSDLCGDTVFIAFEVDNSVFYSVAAADVSDGDSAVCVTSAGFVLADKQAGVLPQFL